MDQLKIVKPGAGDLSQTQELKGLDLTNPNIEEEVDEIDSSMEQNNGISPDIKEYALKMLAGKMAFMKTSKEEISSCGCW